MRLAEHVIRKLELMMHSFHSTRPWSYTVWMDQIPCVYLFFIGVCLDILPLLQF